MNIKRTGIGFGPAHPRFISRYYHLLPRSSAIARDIVSSHSVLLKGMQLKNKIRYILKNIEEKNKDNKDFYN